MTTRPAVPNFFIVGAPKSGTSALFEHLSGHPEVFVPRLKEPMYFGSDLRFLNCRPPTADEYLALFADAENAVRVGEASTTYLYSRLAAAEIKKFNPDARIIIMLRDPVAVMHAWHGENLVKGVEPIRNFAFALEAEGRRRAGHDLPKNRRGLREGLYYRDIVEYDAHVRRYFEIFGPERVHVILFEDWAAATADAFEATLAFLEIDQSFKPSLGVVNPSRLIRSHRVHDLIADPPARLGRATRAVVPLRVRRAARYELLRLNTRTAQRAPIDPALKQRLRAELTPGIERLAALIDRDLSRWTAQPQESAVATMAGGSC
ncbi:MAG TPA: sulfotransferase domain-containing protein [Thermoleophilaceae bacterium]|nr:sulfotransferase domain-containing protein [Thermoleophilaceae bacterium]